MERIRTFRRHRFVLYCWVTWDLGSECKLGCARSAPLGFSSETDIKKLQNILALHKLSEVRFLHIQVHNNQNIPILKHSLRSTQQCRLFLFNLQQPKAHRNFPERSQKSTWNKDNRSSYLWTALWTHMSAAELTPRSPSTKQWELSTLARKTHLQRSSTHKSMPTVSTSIQSNFFWHHS